MTPHEIVSKAQWIEASRALLRQEKAWTRERDRLAEKRRALPWVKVDKPYWLGMVPKGRNEAATGGLTGWAKRHDQYETGNSAALCCAPR